MRRNRLRITAVAGLFVMFAGCGLTFVSELTAPTNVAATANQVEQITLTWSHVPNAGHYYVYRALLPAGPFGPEVGPPYRTVEGNGLVDINVPDSDYYYRVSAGDGFGRLESPMADVVHGTALVAPPTWRLPALTGFGTGLVDIAVDSLLPEEPLYVLTAPATEGAQLSVSLLADDATLVPVGDPFGAVDGTVPGSAAIAVAGGTLFVASTSDTGILDLIAEVVLWRFDSGSGIWVAEAASALLVNAEASEPWIDIEARSPTDLFLAYRYTGTVANGPIASYRYDGATATDLAAALGVIDDVTSVRLSATGTSVVLVYKDMLLLHTPIMVARFAGSAWDVPTRISDDFDVIPDGYVDASIDPITSDLYVAYYDTTGSELVVKENDVATRLSPDAGPASAATPSVAISARNGEVTLFYTDSLGVGLVQRFTGAAWGTLSPDPLTFGGALSSLGVHATAGGLFIGYIEATVGVVRRYY